MSQPKTEETTTTTPGTAEEKIIEAPKTVVPPKIRYTALCLSCFFAFGGYLVFDLCSALKDQMTAEFHLTDTQYSLFYFVYAGVNWFAHFRIFSPFFLFLRRLSLCFVFFAA